MIYFIACAGSPYVKVGHATDLKHRLSELQTGNPQPLSVIDTVEGDRKVEAEIHRALAGFGRFYEWFEREAALLFLADARALGVRDAIECWTKNAEQDEAESRAQAAAAVHRINAPTYAAVDWLIAEYGLKGAAKLIGCGPAALSKRKFSMWSFTRLVRVVPDEHRQAIWSAIEPLTTAQPKRRALRSVA